MFTYFHCLPDSLLLSAVSLLQLSSEDLRSRQVNKDFAEVFPGHGGFADRFDCQILMMIFVYVYMQEIIKGKINSLTSIVSYFGRLSHEDQLKVFGQMQQILALHNQTSF